MRLNATRLGSIASSRSFGDQLYDLAGEVPPLDLNFAGTKTLDPRVTHTRASSATFTGSDGLIKTAVTNLIVQSENFGTTWTTTGLLAFGSGSTLNATTAPNGTTTADLLTENSSTSEHRVETAAISWVASTTYTLSIFAKANGRTRVDFFGVGGGNFTGGREADFNLSTGSVINTDGSIASITPFSNGWYRLRMTFTTSATPSASSIFIRLNDNTSNFSYTGDGTSGIYFWGAQLEQSSTVGEYIPTTSTINSAPRFDHNPTTGESLGLLVEEARTNLWQWSNSATNNETWTNVSTGGLTLTAGQTSPTGDSTAIRAADVDSVTAATTLERTTVAPALTTGTAVTYSIFIKPLSIPNSTIAISVYANGTTDQIRATFGAGPGTIVAPVNTTTGTGSVTSASFVAYPNGWFRLILSGIPSTVTMADCRVRIILGTYARSTGTARFDWYGAQFENNAFASSYFPNAGTLGGVTRAADVASITGSNFSSWYNQTEGTVFMGYLPIGLRTSYPLSIDDGTTNNFIGFAFDSGASRFARIDTGGVTQASITQGLVSVGSESKGALAFAINNVAASFNGTVPTADTSATIPTVDRVRLHALGGSSTFAFNGTIKRLTYWPVRLANTTLQQITQ